MGIDHSGRYVYYYQKIEVLDFISEISNIDFTNKSNEPNPPIRFTNKINEPNSRIKFNDSVKLIDETYSRSNLTTR